ncbi:MAG: hypothetical protein JNL98_35585 [Bryobacterales bacterium]|nr:hypothetical protein [Bryobacterales bacterium]
MRLLVSLGLAIPLAAQVPAFPGAEGAGALASGGRGGRVHYVDNLNASGPGSFADAVSGPSRIVLFRVSGIIDFGGKSIRVDHPGITIAGHTAPGEGICLRNGSLHITASNVIVRHLRSRRGFIRKGNMGDAITAKSPDQRDVILDHVSASWATDENLTVTNGQNITVQYSISSEALDYFNFNQTPPRHAFGSLFGSQTPDGRMTIHHSLYAHNRLRNPRTTGGELGVPLLDFRNNVIYDAKELTSHTGSQTIHANWVANYLKDGPSTGKEGHDIKGVLFTFAAGADHRLYLSGNHIEGYPDRTADNWLATRVQKSSTFQRVEHPFPTPNVTTGTALEALRAVLDDAGCTLPSRDAVDQRIINDVRHGTGAVINFETDLDSGARWPEYASLDAPRDADDDGLPDAWEEYWKLEKANEDADGDGYTNIEEYLNNTNPRGNTKPVVFVSAIHSRAYRGDGTPGMFRVHRSGPLGEPLEVRVAVDGVEHTITMPAGVQWVQVEAKPVATRSHSVIKPLPHSSYAVGVPAAAMVVMDGGTPPPSARFEAIDPKGAPDEEDLRRSKKVLEDHQPKRREKIRNREEVKQKARKKQ